MNKKEYIQKLKTLIVNRVLFHAPIVYDGEVDFAILEILGIDKNLPLFKLSKPLNMEIFQALVLAQKEIDFTIVFSEQEELKKYPLKKLKIYKILDGEGIGYSLLSTINKLNINYSSNSNFTTDIEENYIKINNEEINLAFKEFYLYKKAMSNGVIYDIKEFLLNGKNYIMNFTNPKNQKSEIFFEFNLKLPNGYYFFKKSAYGISIKNLTNNVTNFFNYNCKDANISFSSISGVESSSHACINLRIKLNLKPQEQKRFYFNFGDKQYLFKNIKMADEFFELSQKKFYEMFNVKITSDNKAFDHKINISLPNKIWLAWANDCTDEESEKEYINLKNHIVKPCDNGYQINEEIRGLKEVKIYENDCFKHVYIVSGESRFILADKIKYHNFTKITSSLFQKNNEIYLCFG